MPGAFDVFDAHVHAGTWRTPDFAGRVLDLPEVARTLAAAGVTGALVMPTDTRDNAGLLAAIRAHAGTPDLRMAAWVDPSAPGDLDFLEANRDELSAIKIHPSFSRLPVTDAGFAPFLRFASERGLPVVVHCGRWREVAGWEFALSAAAAWPDAAFVLGHMGGDSPALVAGAAAAIRDRRLANAYLGTESIREYWLVRRAVDVVGPERVVFGSDHNLNHPASFLAVVDALGVDAADRARILGGNARRLFARP